MAESSQNWNIEIIPGSRRVRRAADHVKALLRFPSADGYPSDYPKHPERRGAAAMLDLALDEPAQLPFPGEVGGVVAVPRHSAIIEEG